MIMEMLTNRSFVLSTTDGVTSRWICLKNGVSQGSVLAPVLFNIYMHDWPETTSKKHALYADDVALLHSATTWKEVEFTLERGMQDLVRFFRRWRLRLSEAKTTTTPFHLNTKEAGKELVVHVNGNTLPPCANPRYLGVTLDRTLSFKQTGRMCKQSESISGIPVTSNTFQKVQSCILEITLSHKFIYTNCPPDGA